MDFYFLINCSTSLYNRPIDELHASRHDSFFQTKVTCKCYSISEPFKAQTLTKK